MSKRRCLSETDVLSPIDGDNLKTADLVAFWSALTEDLVATMACPVPCANEARCSRVPLEPNWSVPSAVPFPHRGKPGVSLVIRSNKGHLGAIPKGYQLNQASSVDATHPVRRNRGTGLPPDTRRLGPNLVGKIQVQSWPKNRVKLARLSAIIKRANQPLPTMAGISSYHPPAPLTTPLNAESLTVGQHLLTHCNCAVS